MMAMLRKTEDFLYVLIEEQKATKSLIPTSTDLKNTEKTSAQG